MLILPQFKYLMTQNIKVIQLLRKLILNTFNRHICIMIDQNLIIFICIVSLLEHHTFKPFNLNICTQEFIQPFFRFIQTRSTSIPVIASIIWRPKAVDKSVVLCSLCNPLTLILCLNFLSLAACLVFMAFYLTHYIIEVHIGDC